MKAGNLTPKKLTPKKGGHSTERIYENGKEDEEVMLRNQKNQEVSRLKKQVREIESKVEEAAFFFQVTVPSTRTGKSSTLLFNNLIDGVR